MTGTLKISKFKKENKKMSRNRKFILFLVALAAVVTLSIFGKDSASVVTLFGVYCAGNVGAKVSANLKRNEN